VSRQSNSEIGRSGETAAVAHLESLGYRIRARNIRFRAGEIDLIAEDGNTLVFVEVKTRRGRSYGSAAEAVTRTKQQQLAKLAAIYLSGLSGTPPSCRFDVVAVGPAPGGGWTCELIQNAFSA
jgi:putative endonuclease